MLMNNYNYFYLKNTKRFNVIDYYYENIKINVYNVYNVYLGMSGLAYSN